MAAKFTRSMQLSEMILSLKFHGKEDEFRKKNPFSPDLRGVNEALFDSGYDKGTKVWEYRKWLMDKNNQPCVFGNTSARKGHIFICLLEEQEILRMKKGDEDLKDTIQDHRQVWKRLALDGQRSAFLILLVSRGLAYAEPNEKLKEICRRLVELYLGEDVKDDSILAREYVYLRLPQQDGKQRTIKFGTLPNVFCAQGDHRWWHDHRTPGGIMITSNALGHLIYTETGGAALEQGTKLKALEKAMLTINNAYGGPSRKAKGKFRHCPATSLASLGQGEQSPLPQTSEMRKFSPDHYSGYFHTDHLIPSAFFRKERDPVKLPSFDNLSFRYIYDETADPKDHVELMVGVEAKPFELTRDMDRLPPFANPAKNNALSAKEEVELSKWLLKRLEERLIV
jgi:hypothetical protein